MRTAACLAALLLGLCAASSRAAVILLRDGSRVTGDVLSATAGSVEVATPNGTMTIPAERIMSIDYEGGAQPAAAPPYARARPSWTPGPTSDELSLDFGLDIPLDDVDFSAIGGGRARDGDVGGLVGLRYLHELDDRWAAGFGFDYANRASHDSFSLVPNADATVSGDSELLLGEARYSLVTNRRARPYLLAGVGAHHTTLTVDATPLVGFTWSDTSTAETRRLVDDGAWGLASTARVGVDTRLWGPEVLGFELGWTGLFGGRYAPTRAGSALGLGNLSGPLNVFTLAARVGWEF